jgi:hypothetical protein
LERLSELEDHRFRNSRQAEILSQALDAPRQDFILVNPMNGRPRWHGVNGKHG